jgi:hypothetical protein
MAARLVVSANGEQKDHRKYGQFYIPIQAPPKYGKGNTGK